jgi:hypothetical protein
LNGFGGTSKKKAFVTSVGMGSMMSETLSHVYTATILSMVGMML